VRFAPYGLISGVEVIFLLSGGQVLFLPLFLVLPFGGCVSHPRGTSHARRGGGEGLRYLYGDEPERRRPVG
jgi:hypothetical protein